MGLRGRDLTEIRMKALEELNRVNLSTTLVVTVEKGQNEDEIGEIIRLQPKTWYPCLATPMR